MSKCIPIPLPNSVVLSKLVPQQQQVRVLAQRCRDGCPPPLRHIPSPLPLNWIKTICKIVLPVHGWLPSQELDALAHSFVHAPCCFVWLMLAPKFRRSQPRDLVLGPAQLALGQPQSLVGVLVLLEQALAEEVLAMEPPHIQHLLVGMDCLILELLVQKMKKKMLD